MQGSVNIINNYIVSYLFPFLKVSGVTMVERKNHLAARTRDISVSVGNVDNDNDNDNNNDN